VDSESFEVLVVCTGNVNRSALGAVLLERWAEWYAPALLATRVRVTSAGLGAPEGRSMGRRSRAIAEALGADGSAHRARQITEGMIRDADLVLVAASSQRDDVLGLVPAALRSTFTIREAGRILAALPLDGAPDSIDELRERVAAASENRSTAGLGAHDDDIIDPQGRDDEAYRTMVREEVPALARIAGALFGMPEPEIAAYTEAAEAAEFSFGKESREAAPDTIRTRPRGRREA
jgi:protein-tyrosine phosphatase